MASETVDEFEQAMEEIAKQHRKEMQDGLVDLKLKEWKIEQQFVEYFASDIIDSYKKLMKQRKECIDKFTKFFATFGNDIGDVNIDELYKTIYNSKEVEFDVWKSEMQFFIDVKKDCENCTDEDLENDIRNVFNKD